MTQPGAAPGWYPTPDGGQRYFDGVQWTQHVVPPAARLVAPTVIVNQGPNHLLHLILTLLTCGFWIPVWVIIAIISASGGNRQTIIR